MIGSNLGRLNFNRLRIIHVLVSQLLHAMRQGGGKQQVEPFFRMRHATQQESDILNESQVEHAICFVKNHYLRGFQVENPLLEIVDYSTGSADQDIDPFLKLLAL